MAHNVEYEISLKDLLSGKIREAEGHVNHFEKTLEHSRDLTKELMGAAVGFFGAYQAVEFIKSSIEAYNNVEKSLSQLRAGIESTHGAAGVTYEALTEGAERFAASTIYNKEMLLDMQAQLVSFPEITKEVFESAEQAVMDLATRTGHSLHDVSIMVGKALGDPAHGVAALRRVGVEFDQQQTEIIKKLAQSGHMVQAQQMILKELGREYAGSTAAASATEGGQLEILKHQFDEVKESVGKLVMEETVKLAPTVKMLIGDAKHLVEWIDKNKESIIHTTKVIGEITIAIWALNKSVSVIKGLGEAWAFVGEMAGRAGVSIAEAKVAEEAAASAPLMSAGGASTAVAGEEALAGTGAAATTVSAGGLVVGAAAVFAMAAGVYEFYQKYLSKITNALDGKGFESNEDLSGHEWLEREKKKEAEEKEKSDISALAHATQYTDKNKKFRQDIAMDLMPDDVKKNYEEVYASVKADKVNGKPTEISKISDADFAKYVSTNAELQKAIVNMTALDRQHVFEILDKIIKPGGKGGKSTDATLSGMQSNVTGQTIKNYNVTINGGLIHAFTVQSKTVTEAKGDIKRVATEALTDAVNDFQLNGD